MTLAEAPIRQRAASLDNSQNEPYVVSKRSQLSEQSLEARIGCDL